MGLIMFYEHLYNNIYISVEIYVTIIIILSSTTIALSCFSCHCLMSFSPDIFHRVDRSILFDQKHTLKN